MMIITNITIFSHYFSIGSSTDNSVRRNSRRMTSFRRPIRLTTACATRLRQARANWSIPVNYTIWIPKDVKSLRGVIVHQHGCGEGSCKSGLTGAYDLHWQALAKKHDCALLSPSYEQPEKADCQMWCDPRNGSSAAFQKCLVDLGAKSGHPELAKVPWALWGHSGGGHWAGGMVLLHPDRVAAAWLRSGVPLLKADPERATIKAHTLPDAALKVPVMCNLGTKEGVTVKDGRFAGVWPANEAFFNEVRGKGGLIGVAVDPLTTHECGNQRYLAIPWLDACLSARLPKARRSARGHADGQGVARPRSSAAKPSRREVRRRSAQRRRGCRTKPSRRPGWNMSRTRRSRTPRRRPPRRTCACRATS